MRIFSVVYFSRGTLPQKGHYWVGDLVEKLPMASLTGDQREIGKPIILWMDKILYYFETWEPICLLVFAEE